MCTIRLYDIMLNRNYPDSGDVLYNQMVDNIASSDKVVLDLDGVVALPTMFLNVSIGRFMDMYGVEVLKQKVSFARVSASQIERLKNYISIYSSGKA